jgi:hypothetical protein
MRTQAIEVQQDRRGRVIVNAAPRRRVSWTARGLWALARLPFVVTRAVARRAWRYRWHLTPLFGGAWMLRFGAAAPAATLLALALAGTLSAAWAWRGRKVDGRMYLSVIERAALAEGLLGAGLWVAGEWSAAAAGVHTPAVLDIGAYVVLTGHAAGQWWWSRRPAGWRREPKDARLYTGQWDAVAAVQSTKLTESWIRRETVQQVRGEDVRFRVRLEHAHSGEVGENERLLIERVIKGPKAADLQPGSVTVTHPNDTVNEIEVAISPARAVESRPVESTLHLAPIPEHGRIVVSQEPSGRMIEIERFDDSGVHFGTIIGGSTAGKSSTLRAFAMRGPATLNDRGQPIETVWSLDGGMNTSTPELSPAWDINAVRPWQFPIVFEAFHAIHLDRMDRRGDPADPRSRYRTWIEEDQIITLLLQETPGLMAYFNGQHDQMFAGELKRIRKLGMSVIVETQSITRGNIPGGQWIEDVRDQLFTNGFVLAHRAGGENKRAMQASGDATLLTKQQNALPAKGGWHIAIDQGQLLSPKTRSPWASHEQSAAAAQTITPRPIAGRDLQAACRVPGFKELYEHRHDPLWTPPATEQDDEEPTEALVTGPRPFQPVHARPAETAKAKALRAIRERYAEVGDEKPPLSKAEICKRAGISTGAWHTARQELLAEGLIKLSDRWPGRYIPAFPKGS